MFPPKDAVKSQELIDLTQLPGEQVPAQFLVQGNSDFDNVGGLYRLTDAEGTVLEPLTGALIAPGEQGYAQAALAQSVVQFDENDTDLMVNLDGGYIYAPYLMAGGNREEVYFPFLGANPNGVDQLRLLGDNTFGFEDLPNGGDGDYNDLVFQVNLT